MAIETLEITLPAELLAFAESLKTDETYDSIDDVIVEALSRLQSSMRDQQFDTERLREEIQKGIESADRGECVNGPEFMEALIGGRNSVTARNGQSRVLDKCRNHE